MDNKKIERISNYKDISYFNDSELFLVYENGKTYVVDEKSLNDGKKMVTPYYFMHSDFENQIKSYCVGNDLMKKIR